LQVGDQLAEPSAVRVGEAAVTGDDDDGGLAGRVVGEGGGQDPVGALGWRVGGQEVGGVLGADVVEGRRQQRQRDRRGDPPADDPPGAAFDGGNEPGEPRARYAVIGLGAGARSVSCVVVQAAGLGFGVSFPGLVGELAVGARG
jgi:hypothetical protein